MRRCIAILLLVVVGAFLVLTGRDHCEDGPAGHGQSSQHILCIDDCTPAVISERITPPPQDSLPKTAYQASVVEPILDLSLEPDTDPPRA